MLNAVLAVLLIVCGHITGEMRTVGQGELILVEIPGRPAGERHVRITALAGPLSKLTGDIEVPEWYPETAPFVLELDTQAWRVGALYRVYYQTSVDGSAWSAYKVLEDVTTSRPLLVMVRESVDVPPLKPGAPRVME